MAADAGQVQAHRFDSLWLSEHHFWYDGWCPQPLIAAGAALAATSTLCVGTAVHLLTQHDPRRTAAQLATLQALSGNRFVLGVGLGYRHEEFDGVGLRRRDRGRLMDENLAILRSALAGYGLGGTEIWYGGAGYPALQRAKRAGLSILLPQTTSPTEVREYRAALRAVDPRLRVGVVKDVWITDKVHDAGWFRARFRLHSAEIKANWTHLADSGELLATRSDLLAERVRAAQESALVGTADQIAQELRDYVAAGADLLIVHVCYPTTAPEYVGALLRLGAVLPTIRGLAR
jgi:alkanesulfonate monooxygenase SsuD/methylene tetrahydromethanopterin reductase-like flavin-dependent oxidoreductase (luciferase family)